MDSKFKKFNVEKIGVTVSNLFKKRIYLKTFCVCVHTTLFKNEGHVLPQTDTQ